MALTLGNCARCNSVYNTRFGSQLCPECYLKDEGDRALVESAIETRHARTVSDVTAATRLPRTRVRKILRQEPRLAQGLEPDGACSQCGGHRALASSGRCVGCQLALYKSLGDVAAAVAFAPRPKTIRDRGRMHILAAVHEKRQRTGSYRFHPATRSIKGNVG